MSTVVGIGFSQDPDPSQAAFETCVQVKNRLNVSEASLALVFASPSYAVPAVLGTLSKVLRPQHLIGSSAGGLIVPDNVSNRGITVVGVHSNEIHFATATVSAAPKLDLHDMGIDLARRAVKNLNSPHRDILITFSEGMEQNGSQFLRGAQTALGQGFPIVGAISSDDFKHKDLKQFFQDQLLTHSTVGLLVGDAAVSLGCHHGFTPLGKPRRITKVTDQIIRTIDNQPAGRIYEHFLGEHAHQQHHAGIDSHYLLYPLGIYLEEEGQYLLRHVLDILADGSIVCHGNVPEGAEVHLMLSNKDSCLRSATEAAETVKTSLHGKQAQLVLVFESLARWKILGSSAFNEIQAIKNVLGYTTPLAGMYSFGEMAPLGSLENIKRTHLHNATILIIAIT